MAWKGAVIIGLIAGSAQMLMDVRPPPREELEAVVAEAA